MKKYQGIIKKSRTLDLAAITAIVGTLVATLPQLQAMLSEKHYGIALIVLSASNAYLRSQTTGKVGAK